MFEFRDLFQWERFITPSIIKIFYWLVLAMAVLGGLQMLFSGLALMFVSPIAGVLTMAPGAVVIWFVRNHIAKGFALGRV